jgi:hypothetical protein
LVPIKLGGGLFLLGRARLAWTFKRRSGFYGNEADDQLAFVRVEVTSVGVLADFSVAVPIANTNLGVMVTYR